MGSKPKSRPLQLCAFRRRTTEHLPQPQVGDWLRFHVFTKNLAQSCFSFRTRFSTSAICSHPAQHFRPRHDESLPDISRRIPNVTPYRQPMVAITAAWRIMPYMTPSVPRFRDTQGADPNSPHVTESSKVHRPCATHSPIICHGSYFRLDLVISHFSSISFNKPLKIRARKAISRKATSAQNARTK